MHLLHSVGYTYCIVRACALSVVPCVLSGIGLTSTCYPGLVYRPVALVSYCMYVLAVGIVWRSGICAALITCVYQRNWFDKRTHYNGHGSNFLVFLFNLCDIYWYIIMK